MSQDLKSIRESLREIEGQISDLTLCLAEILIDLERRIEARREAGTAGGDEGANDER